MGKPYRELTAAFLPSSLRRTHPFAWVHLYQPTCVGFRYGFLLIFLEVFLGSAL